MTIRFVIGPVVVASLPLAVTGYIIDQNNFNATRQALEVTHRSATEQAERAVAISAESIIVDLQRLSNEPIMRKEASDIKAIAAAVDRYYEPISLPLFDGSNSVQQHASRFEDLAVFRVEGDESTIEVSAGSKFSGEWATSSWLKKAAAGTVSYSPPYFDNRNSALISSIAVPVFSESGKVIRVIGAQIHMSRLLSLAGLEGFAERDHVDLRLLDRFGNYIAGVQDELLLERAEPVPQGFSDTTLMNFTEGGITVVGSELAVGGGTIWANEGWRIRSVESANSAFAQFRQARNSLILGFVTGFVLIAALSLLVGRGATRPLRVITRAITELGSGDYSARLKPRSGREFETLVRSFNSMADSLQTTHDDLIAIDRAKSEFLSGLSHELRTPLAAMMGFAQVIKKNRDGDLSAKTLERIDVIDRNGKRLDTMINDLLDLTRIENKKIQLTLSWFEIGDLIHDITQSFETVLSDRQNLLTVNSPTLSSDNSSGSSIWINGDRDRIAQILTNLISNASKYSDKGSRITVGVEMTGEQLTIGVTDQGQGISDGDMHRLFTLFYRTEAAASSSTPGSGIGLFISKRIAELHGGDVAVQSRQGQGSTFTLTLPGATHAEPTELRDLSEKKYTSRFDDLELKDAS